MENIWITLLGYLIAPITGVVSWFAGRKKANNDFLKDMQESIDLLSEKNKTLIDEVVSLREINSKMKYELFKISQDNTRLREDISDLRKDNEELRQEVESLNTLLQNVKSITRKK